ncbi:sensor histidine kinase [Mahella australiensis]|uniref:Signal transduction histidine kinase, LytS n=1 Tax=Mahella australiensis (strain DSM 15567 / CIP 107919 / 50-1 BON) TaxID=697281 RepID=F3ZWS4_MAHA5|nr:histidine kinase [Mahella australiensis]AEE96517.1 signal transduction histidine kinase, LytS [Mahella australiensis 50-1 BON]
MWMGSHQIELFARSKDPNETEVFSFIKKLYSIDHQYMGIMVLDIKVSDMFNELTNLYNNNYYFYILDNSNKVLFPYNAVLPATIKQNALGNKGYDIRGDTLYVYDTVDPIGVKIISVFNMLTNESIKDNLQKARINMLLTIGISILSMLLLLYLSLKFIFKEINYMLGMMQEVAQGNLNIRIPIEYNDEIGRMAYNFNILIDKINALMKSMLKKESDKRNAEFAALQYQMNPHFIYNAIDIINSKLELDGNYDGAEAIAIFGKILRYNMNNDYKYIPIKDEVENVKNYIELQKIKYGDKVSLNVNLPSDLADHKVIKFIIQPLVENSIKHGFSNSKSSININVDFHIIDCNLEITVRDDGVGISDKRLNEINDVLASNIEEDEHLLNNTKPNGSIGLKNISDRIKLFYGPQYSVRLYSQEGQYTKTVITIPFHTQLK